MILPIRFDRSKLILAGFGFQGIARLRPGVTIAQANADVGRMVPIWMNSWSNGPGTNPRFYETWRITPALRPLKQEVVDNIGGVLWVVTGTIGLVMLNACANVANLLLVKAEARQQELAIRAALGAGRGQIVRELLLESMLLAFTVVLSLLSLLVSAGPVIPTFQALRTVEPGFTHAEHLQIMRISIPASLVPEPQQVTRIQNNIAGKLAAIPGVTSVGFASAMPMEGSNPLGLYRRRGQDLPRGPNPAAPAIQECLARFLSDRGTRLIASRELN